MSTRKQSYWRGEILALLDGGVIVRTGEGWCSGHDDPAIFPRYFPTRQLQLLANDGLINSDFKETGKATRQRELPFAGDLGAQPRSRDV
jgi:hypothetical protein